ncbi:MAG: 4'-phosphopantetheinyl transferase superfamily protein [Acidobacteria bacterium]|nr:4'-phosphopantetheinyl transferase superfamily protein [Acidobacteriota bacterium]
MARRTVLGAWTGTAPEHLVFVDGPHGKPALPGGPEFNVSHSGDAVLIGVVDGIPIGVDVERVREKPNLDGIARRFFSAPEAAYLESLAPEARTNAFYRLWTLKEALVKAIGTGIAGNLSQTEVDTATLLDEHPRFLRVPSEAGDPERLGVFTFEALPGHLAAAVTLSHVTFTVRKFPI